VPDSPSGRLSDGTHSYQTKSQAQGGGTGASQRPVGNLFVHLIPDLCTTDDNRRAAMSGGVRSEVQKGEENLGELEFYLCEPSERSQGAVDWIREPQKKTERRGDQAFP